jgi:hypothetical protein
MIIRLFLSILLFSFFTAPFFVYAGDRAGEVTMEVSPGTETFVVDEEATIKLLVSSDGQSANAVEGQLSYDPKMITVTNISREGSLVGSWTEEPILDGDLGLIAFGGMLATSTVLERGLILSLNVRPLRTGEFSLHFEQGAAVHAADGTGGNMLTGFRDGRYRITPKDLSAATADDSLEGEVLGAATATPPITITSSTHPDQGAWYSASSSVFLFHVEEGVTKIRLGFDTKADGLARVSYAPTISEKTIDHIDDGVWYLHLAADLVDAPTWSMSYMLHVDHTPPEQFTVTEVARSNTADPKVSFMLTATDTPSGVDHYLMAIDGEEAVRFIPDDDQQFHARALPPGVHALHATVVDKAGNTLSLDQSFEVTHLASPQVTFHDTALGEGDPLRLLIQGPKDAAFTVFFAQGDAAPIMEKVSADGSGNANFVSNATLVPGTYHVWASATDRSGGISKESARVTIQVAPSLWGSMTRHLFISASLFALIILALFGLRFQIKHRRKSVPENTIMHERKKDLTPAVLSGRIVLPPRVRGPEHPPLRLRRF